MALPPIPDISPDPRRRHHFRDYARNVVYDRVIVGGGPAALLAAYETLRMAKDDRTELKLAVVATNVASPTRAGSNVMIDIDGFDGDTRHPSEREVQHQLRAAANLLEKIIRRESIECRFAKGYQFLALQGEDVGAAKDFLVQRYGYEPSSLRALDASERLKFRGVNAALGATTAAQVNMPELQLGLSSAIRKLGGQVFNGVTYQGQQWQGTSMYIETDCGPITSHNNPLLATGPHLGELGLPVSPMSTGAMHIELTPEDVRKVSPRGRPVAFSDIRMQSDVLWGALDQQRVLTLGFGESSNPHTRAQMEKNMRAIFHKYLPQLGDKYDRREEYSFGTQSMTPNGFPLIGRLRDYDVIGGLGSRGLMPGLAAAHAFASWYVREDDKALKVLEALNVNEVRRNIQRNRSSSSDPTL